MHFVKCNVILTYECILMLRYKCTTLMNVDNAIDLYCYSELTRLTA